MIRIVKENVESDIYLCVGSVKNKDATQYHHCFEFVVTKWDHDERDLELYDVPR